MNNIYKSVIEFLVAYDSSQCDISTVNGKGSISTAGHYARLQTQHLRQASCFCLHSRRAAIKMSLCYNIFEAGILIGSPESKTY